MASEYDSLAEQAARDNRDHLAYLLKLTERELIESERKSAERRLNADRFPAHKALAQFDSAAQTTVNKPLAIYACSQGKRVRFWRVTELITCLLEAKEERQLLRIRNQLDKLDLLVLDELGYVPASKAGAELLFDVIATAYERNSIIFTV